jgi:hypothetical protein
VEGSDNMQEMKYGQMLKKKGVILKKKCFYCEHKFENGETLEYLFNGGGYNPFCMGHLEKWANEKRRGYILEKL